MMNHFFTQPASDTLLSFSVLLFWFGPVCAVRVLRRAYLRVTPAPDCQRQPRVTSVCTVYVASLVWSRCTPCLIMLSLHNLCQYMMSCEICKLLACLLRSPRDSSTKSLSLLQLKHNLFQLHYNMLCNGGKVNAWLTVSAGGTGGS